MFPSLTILPADQSPVLRGEVSTQDLPASYSKYVKGCRMVRHPFLTVNPAPKFDHVIDLSNFPGRPFLEPKHIRIAWRSRTERKMVVIPVIGFGAFIEPFL